MSRGTATAAAATWRRNSTRQGSPRSRKQPAVSPMPNPRPRRFPSARFDRPKQGLATAVEGHRGTLSAVPTVLAVGVQRRNFGVMTTSVRPFPHPARGPLFQLEAISRAVEGMMKKATGAIQQREPMVPPISTKIVAALNAHQSRRHSGTTDTPAHRFYAPGRPERSSEGTWRCAIGSVGTTPIDATRIPLGPRDPAASLPTVQHPSAPSRRRGRCSGDTRPHQPPVRNAVLSFNRRPTKMVFGDSNASRRLSQELRVNHATEEAPSSAQHGTNRQAARCQRARSSMFAHIIKMYLVFDPRHLPGADSLRHTRGRHCVDGQ